MLGVVSYSIINVQHIVPISKQNILDLAKLTRANVLFTLYPSSNLPLYSLDYIKLEYHLYKKTKNKTKTYVS